MINSTVLVGRLTKDLELRYTQNGKANTAFNLAVDRPYKNDAGERPTDFIRCIVWGKTAENLAKYTQKGHRIAVQGAIQTRTFENDQGQRIYITEVNVNNFMLLESKNQNQTETFDPYASQNGNGLSNEMNQTMNGQIYPGQSQNEPEGNIGRIKETENTSPFSVVDISDDGLPF